MTWGPESFTNITSYWGSHHLTHYAIIAKRLPQWHHLPLNDGCGQDCERCVQNSLASGFSVRGHAHPCVRTRLCVCVCMRKKTNGSFFLAFLSFLPSFPLVLLQEWNSVRSSLTSCFPPPCQTQAKPATPLIPTDLLAPFQSPLQSCCWLSHGVVVSVAWVSAVADASLCGGLWLWSGISGSTYQW